MCCNQPILANFDVKMANSVQEELINYQLFKY